MRSLIILLLITITISVSAQTDTSFNTIFVAGGLVKTKQVIPDTDYVVLFENPNAKVDLKKNELDEIKKILMKLVKDKNLKDFSEYKRQYSAFIDKEGNKIVRVYCFCRYDQDWKKYAIVPIDGGKCYFQLKINLQTKKYSELHINSEA